MRLGFFKKKNIVKRLSMVNTTWNCEARQKESVSYLHGRIMVRLWFAVSSGSCILDLHPHSAYERIKSIFMASL